MSVPLWIDEVGKLVPAVLAPVAAIGAVVTIVLNRRWKRAELASGYLKELNQNHELVFACRCLDWGGGRLVVPDGLRPLQPETERTMEHDPALIGQAMDTRLTISEVIIDYRLQVYRIAIDSLLSWFATLANSIDRGLFTGADLPEVDYYVRLVLARPELAGFIDRYDYRRSLDTLARAFRHSGRELDARQQAPEELSVAERIMAAHKPERARVSGIDHREVR